MIQLHNLGSSQTNGLTTIMFRRWIGHAFVRLTSKNDSTDGIHASNALRAQHVSSARSSNHTYVLPHSSIYQGYIFLHLVQNLTYRACPAKQHCGSQTGDF